MKSLFILFLSLNTFALVDYTDDVSPSAPAIKRAAPVSARKVTRRKAPRRSSGPSNIELKTSFASHEYKTETEDRKVESITLDGHLQTDYNIYLDFAFPIYTGKLSKEQTETSYQKGNPELIVGLNWLEIGGGQDALTFDVYGGLRFGQKSDFASERTDKIVGVETAKRFFDFALNLGYEMHFTGSSKNNDEQDIGNIGHLKAQLGWLVSQDIRFIVNAGNVGISDSNDEGRTNRLEKKIKYSYIQPEMVLTMGPGVYLNMKALFQSRRPKREEVSNQSKLWSLPGVYGNSLAAGLNISI